MTFTVYVNNGPRWRFTIGISHVDSARRYYAEIQHVPVSDVKVEF